MLEIGEKYKVSEVSKEQFAEWAKICNADGAKHIDLDGEYYVINPNKEPSLKIILVEEKADLEQWLRAHDYIGTKIATGRATVEEYATEIAEMTAKANRINEIDEELSNL